MSDKEKQIDEMLQAFLDKDLSSEELGTFEQFKQVESELNKDVQLFEQIEQIYQAELTDSRPIDLTNSVMDQIEFDQAVVEKVDNFAWLLPAACSVCVASLIIYFFPASFSWTSSISEFFGITESLTSFQTELLSVPQNLNDWLLLQKEMLVQFDLPEIYPSLSLLSITLIGLMILGMVLLSFARQKYQFSHYDVIQK